MNDGFSGLRDFFRSTRFASLIRFMSGQTWKGRYYSMTIEEQYVRAHTFSSTGVRTMAVVMVSLTEHAYIDGSFFFILTSIAKSNVVSFTEKMCG